MQTNSYSQKGGLTGNQTQHNKSSSGSTMFSSDSDRPTSSARDTIARSMSRYKGNRQAKPNSNPPLPQLDLSSHLQHSRKSSQQFASPQSQSPRRDKPPIQSDGEARDIYPTSETVRFRKPSIPKTSTIRVGDTVRKAENQLGGAQNDNSELGVPSSPNKQTTSKSGGKDEAHVTVSRVFGPKALSRDLLPSLNGDDGPNTRESRRNRDVQKIHRPEPPCDADRLSDNHRRVRHLPIESQRKIEKSDKFGIFNVSHTPLPKKSFSERMADHINKYQPSARSNSKTDLKRLISTPIAMPQGGEVTSPSFDAPISAVNAGERRVIVQCKDSLISLPVTPTTTPLDIISSSAAQNLYSVNAKTSVLLESFKKVGLERPLRKYEHIRDVLNSWDSDEQNTLTIVPSPTAGNDDDLEARNVSKEQPGETSVYLYYSQKPGRWDKRWVTLRSDGQVAVKKTGKDSVNICHLSDFDIYVPTPRHLAKKIKPPKKLCFAVKSQQKSSMFLSTANFVHFFSTSDKVIATTWYKAVQQWRSWYLVNILGEGQNPAKVITGHKLKNSKDPSTTSGVHNEPFKPTPTAYDSAHDRKDSINMEMSQPSGRRQGVSTAQENGHLVNGARKPKSAPPISFPKNLSHDLKLEVPTSRAQGHIARNIEPEPFATTGLLGRTYSQRQKAQRDGLDISTSHPAPHHHTVMPSPTQEENGGLKRASSQRQKPKPLIDLTPQYQEPPQHSKKGRGIIPQQIPAGGLVDIATSPEIAIPIPPNRTWRRPTTSSGEPTVRTPTHADFRRDHLFPSAS